MNLQQLEYFKVIAKTQNFTAAAHILLITQPALSKTISKLEEELEVPLFEREGRNIKITPFGETFLKYADAALNEIERGKEKLQEMKRHDDFILSIASTNCIGATFIPFLISTFLSNHLQTRFNLNTQSSEEILKHLKYGRVDFGFFDDLKEMDAYPEIEAVFVKKEAYVLIVPKNHHLANKEEVALEALREENFIVYKGKSQDEKVSYEKMMGYTPKIIAEPNESSILSGLVAAGAGIAIVLDTPMINTNKISIVKIKDDIGYKKIYMGWNKQTALSAHKQAFKAYVLNLNEERME
ncbi:LysR family transcriptional regulator [Niameybacter massiliensis]|uniref:LysR family transcriptional regulator n=1 Tax=Niameybacter massiliensis TaxID=1658108 RepID=UPI0006B584B6|nr:LysR family transcriptional regulator [Niameybacter massiliensis]